MRWWPRRREGRPSLEAEHAAAEARRGRRDVENLTCRADEVARKLQETRRRNHFAEAITRSIRRV